MSAPRRVLIVDDEATVRYVLIRTIQRHGHECKEAINGEDALRVLERWPCDLVIADYLMAPMDGLAMVRKLRALGNAIPVIVMTGRVTDELAAEQAPLRIAAVLSKPCTVPDLDEAVTSALASAVRAA